MRYMTGSRFAWGVLTMTSDGIAYIGPPLISSRNQAARCLFVVRIVSTSVIGGVYFYLYFFFFNLFLTSAEFDLFNRNCSDQ